jgi:acetoacetyl-CoA reductase
MTTTEQTQPGQLGTVRDRVTFVTGGTRGIGAAICRALAGAGAAVAAGYWHQHERAQQFHDEMLAAYPQSEFTVHEGNIGSADDCRRVLSEVIDRHGRLDILVNNAGIFPMKRLRELDAATWDRTNGVNLRGAYLCTRHAAERIIAGSAGGRIINISTINTARTYLGMAHYDASKYGLNALTKASALEYAPFGITVNAIAPGAVKTPGSLKVRSELGGGSVEAADAEFAKRIPLGRWAEPEDIGRAVLCLTGRAADYITGQIIYADGGLMLGF